MNLSRKHTALIKDHAKHLGFSAIGISKAEFMDEEARKLEMWLKNGYQGSMHYMERNFDKRVDPSKLVPGAKSVISLMYNYYTKKEQFDKAAPRISSYAFGKDYHFVIKQKLKNLLSFIQDNIGLVSGRCFVDSAPVLERDWAKRSGIGWIGKNTLLINKKKGSFYFLAELIIDLQLDYDYPIKDHCGTCKRCIEACPTQAIAENGYVLDSNKCISYLTIELREEIPTSFKSKMENWVFGCDICQQVCPWNRFSTLHSEPDFEPKPELLEMTRNDWIDITEEIFGQLFNETPVMRTKFRGLRRNIDFLTKKGKKKELRGSDHSSFSQ